MRKPFWHYLLKHTRQIIAYFFICLIFSLIFFLRNISLEPLIYAIELSTFVVALFIFFGYRRFSHKCEILSHLVENGCISIEQLPKADDMLEKGYQDLVASLLKENKRLSSEFDAYRHETNDYTLLWAHQIKIPIAGLRLLTEESSYKPEKVKMELSRIEQYVEMVLQYQRLNSISSDLLIESCALDSLIRQAIRKQASFFILKKITLDYQETSEWVLTDEKWLVFVLEQLLSNAIKYTKSGGTITISYQNHTLTIADTGIGIRAEDLPRLGERGFTGYNGRMDKKSTGLGLYLSHQICARLQLSLRFASQLNQGTEAMIVFPSAENKTISA